MQSSRRLTVEQLEDRCVPAATFGSLWPDATHLTLSFAPDGTSVLGHSSVFFQTLNAIAPTATWEHEILRAFQTWAVQTNINIAVVPDDGSPLGTPGAPQGDPRFGDIRIAGFAMPSGEMAVTSPFDFTAGTWSGDSKLNTAYKFSIGGGNGVDLYTAMLHEAAHSFGLHDNNDPNSAAVLNYSGPVTGLDANDIANIQALYGVRNPEASNNGTFATATPLTMLANSNTSLGIQANGDVNSLSDADFYSFKPPSGVVSTTIHLNASGISLLDARVTVYDSSFRVVGSAVATDPLHNDLTINLSARAGSTYYIKVQSGTNDVFGIGSYKVEIDSQTLVSSLTGLLSGVTKPVLTLVNDLLPLNTSFLTALLLPPVTSQTTSPFSASFRGSINSGSTQEYFRVQAPQPQAGQANVLTVMAWGTDARNFQPRVSVYDANQNLIAATVVVNENGTFVVQVPNAVGGASYYVKVAANPSGPHNTGSFLLAVQFGPTTVDLQGVTQGTLGPTQSQAFGTLTVQQGSLMHFVLSAQAANASTAAAVRLTILDVSGTAVASAVAYNGSDPVSLTQVLSAGNYTVLLTEYTPAGSALPVLAYSVQASRLDEPIGPQPQDSTSAPAGAPPPSNTTSPPPSGSTTPSSPPPSGSTPPPSSPPPSYTPPPSGSTSTTSGSSPPTSSGTTSGSSSSYNNSNYYYYQQSGSNVPPQDPYSSPYKTS